MSSNLQVREFSVRAASVCALTLGLFSAMGGFLTSCGSDKKENTAATTTAPTYDSVKTIMDTTCGGCHDSLKTLAGIKTSIPAKLAAAIKGEAYQGKTYPAMPSGDTKYAFRDSADGKKLLDWLANGSDLK